MSTGETIRPDWQEIACAFRWTADHALKCKSRETMEGDDCNCPLREPMRALRDAMTGVGRDPLDVPGMVKLD